jgi:Icc-related predicted phosphoesterase
LLLVSDLHGSNACFQKLVDLAIEERVDFVAVAGDWSGKRSILYERTDDGGLRYRLSKDKTVYVEDWEETVEQWNNCGLYSIDQSTLKTNLDEFDLLRSFRVRRLMQWLDYGEKTCGKRGIRLYSIPGNDDEVEMTELLSEHPWVCDVDQRVAMIGSHEILGLGYSNPTPWKTPREISEAEIAKKLEVLASQLRRPEESIAMIHVPPFGIGLDLAPELRRRPDGQLEMTGNGDIPVGSRAVLEFIEKASPLVVLSGHCHTSRNFNRIGATNCFNAGSEYHAGMLCACIIVISQNSLIGHHFLVR